MQKAFTLIELAIVIVIIGLIVGGVLGAGSLINSAKRNQLITDFNSYVAAINAFKLEYDALPGDFDEASDYWSVCVNEGGSNPCNGDGDKIIERGGGPLREDFRLWQHLSLAEIIPGGYTGLHGVTGFILGENTPEGPYQGSGYWVDTKNFTLSGTQTYLRTTFTIAARNPSDTDNLENATISPRDAKSIDSKLDDGIAYTGKMIGYVGNDYTSSNTCISSSDYDLSESNRVCRIFINFLD